MSEFLSKSEGLINLIHNLGDLIYSIGTFIVFFCKSLINLFGRFLAQFWGQDFNAYFTSQFPVLGQYIGGYANYFVIAVTLLLMLYFYQFLMRRIKGR